MSVPYRAARQGWSQAAIALTAAGRATSTGRAEAHSVGAGSRGRAQAGRRRQARSANARAEEVPRSRPATLLTQLQLSSSNIFWTDAVLIIIGMGIGVFGSMTAIRRFLDV